MQLELAGFRPKAATSIGNEAGGKDGSIVKKT
jgi:hypothetical protein